jgi:hypothetical protein
LAVANPFRQFSDQFLSEAAVLSANAGRRALIIHVEHLSQGD